MNSATQMGDVKTLLAPCLNWGAVLRSMFLLVGTRVFVKRQLCLFKGDSEHGERAEQLSMLVLHDAAR